MSAQQYVSNKLIRAKYIELLKRYCYDTKTRYSSAINLNTWIHLISW